MKRNDMAFVLVDLALALTLELVVKGFGLDFGFAGMGVWCGGVVVFGGGDCVYELCMYESPEMEGAKRKFMWIGLDSVFVATANY